MDQAIITHQSILYQAPLATASSLRTGPPFLSTYPPSEAQTTHHSVSLAPPGLAAPETEGESRSHEGHVALSPAAQTPINCKCSGAQNPNNSQCFWENEPVASRGGSTPLPDEAYTKGPQPSLSTQPKTSPVLGPGAESSTMGLSGLPGLCQALESPEGSQGSPRAGGGGGDSVPP